MVSEALQSWVGCEDLPCEEAVLVAVRHVVGRWRCKAVVEQHIETLETRLQVSLAQNETTEHSMRLDVVVCAD